MDYKDQAPNEETIKKLLDNSIAAFWAAIEIHNKPNFRYRYEVVVLLVINAWELLLKAYMMKHLPLVRMFDDRGISKSLEECISSVFSTLKKDYYPIRDNLFAINRYRNSIVHFYSSQIDVIIFSLLSKNIQFFNKFVKTYFEIDLAECSDLVLLPIGFKKFISPIDYLSNDSVANEANEYVKDFLKSITSSIKTLYAEDIDESIIVDYSIYLENVKNIKNADLIVRVDPASELSIAISKKYEVAALTNSPDATEIYSRSFSIPPTTEEEEIISWTALKIKDPKFIPNEENLWGKYLNRKSLKLREEQIQALVYFSVMNTVAVFFWIKELKNEIVLKIIESCIDTTTDQFVLSYCREIAKYFKGKLANQIIDKLNRRLNSKIIKVTNTLQDHSVFSRLKSWEKSSGFRKGTPDYISFVENELDALLVTLSESGKGIESAEARKIDEILYRKIPKLKK